MIILFEGEFLPSGCVEKTGNRTVYESESFKSEIEVL